MVFKHYLLAAMVLFVFNKALYAGACEWQRLTQGLSAIRARSVVLDEDDPDIIYAGFNNGLYKTIDSGENWVVLGSTLIKDINDILLDRENRQTIYAATKKGLFRSGDSGLTWQRIYTGRDVLERDILCTAICYDPPKTVLIGTRAGIFFSPANRIIWQKASGKLSDCQAISILADSRNPDILYIASNKGVFKTQDRVGAYKMIYNVSNIEDEDNSAEDGSEDAEEALSGEEYFFKNLTFDADDKNRLYLATQGGLVVSMDGGEYWQKRSFSGLLSEDINYVLLSRSEDRLFLATENGVFDCEGDNCKQLHRGMDFMHCYQLALDSQDNLYAASDKGLFRMSLKDRKSHFTDIKKRKSSVCDNEPTISQIQKEAIEYAEVYPRKIADWRTQARIKALLPELTLGYDKTVSVSASYDKSIVGPRDWGLSLKWDLADFVFSTDQTSIDVRSRLMVQLRDDILSEVNRYYFERKRLKAELEEEEDLDEEARFQKELRLEELTASLDGLTGGYLTRTLGNRRK